MFQEVRVRRAAVGAAVFALHILLLLVLLAALHPPEIGHLGMREIIVRLMPQTAEKARERQNPFRIPQPIFIRPVLPQAITPPTQTTAPAAPEGDIRAVGRYLFNCSGAEYEKLSPREKEHCLANKWDNKGPVFTLGPAKPSPFDAVIAKRNAPVRSPTKDCGAGVPNVNLGMSCMDFGNSQAPSGQDNH